MDCQFTLNEEKVLVEGEMNDRKIATFQLMRSIFDSVVSPITTFLCSESFIFLFHFQTGSSSSITFQTLYPTNEDVSLNIVEEFSLLGKFFDSLIKCCINNANIISANMIPTGSTEVHNCPTAIMADLHFSSFGWRRARLPSVHAF